MRQILLITDPGDEQEALREALAASGAEVLRPRTPDGAIGIARLTPPSLIVVALAGEAAWDLVARLKADAATRSIPVLAFRADPNTEDIARARAAGADSYEALPPSPARVQAKLERLFSLTAPSALSSIPNLDEVVATPAREALGRVLLLLADPDEARALSTSLDAAGYEVVIPEAPGAARDLAAGQSFDVLLLDLGLPSGRGLELLWQVRERHGQAELPIIVVSGRSGGQEVLHALELGANDFITRPVDLPVVTARLRIHVSLRRAARDLAESEARYRLLAENSSDIVTRSDLAGTWTYLSPACRRLLGYEPAELVGRSAYDLIHPDDFNALARSYDDILGQPDVFSLRFRMQRKDGRYAWFEATLNTLRDAAGLPAELQAAYRDVTTQVERQSAIVEEMMVRFGRIAEFRTGETRGHIQRMSHACGVLARRAGCDSLLSEQIRVAATLHDFGNVLIPMEILHKPGPLTEEEWAVVRRGPELGWELLRDSGIEVLERAATISWYHHEHWDGSGYPRGRRSKGIPLEGRVALICDVFDMMTSELPGRPAMSVEAAVGEMVRGRGRRFDPELLDLFLQDLGEIVALRERFPDASTEHARAPTGPGAR